LRSEELPAQLAASTGKVIPAFEMELRFANERSLHLAAGAVPLFDSQGQVRGSVTAGLDITERKKAEEALKQRTLELQHLTQTLEERVKERTAELATLSSEILVAQEKERKRISYDLHDNVWQTLEIIRVQLEHLFSSEGEADWPAFHRKSKQLIPVIRDTIARVRSMQGDLWPSVLDDIGVVATLEWYCREFGKNNPGLGIEKNVGLAEDEVPATAKIVIYRLMQEALSNVAKHSQASQVSLSLNKSDHSLELIIRDNGIGFDPEEAIARKSPWGGLGLRSMKERTEFSGGLFGVESAKGQGTTIRASWPLSGNS
jgi:signal transduction histidine kinase